MDRMIFTALNALDANRADRVSQAQNLANMQVPGYRRDLPPVGETRFLDQLGSLDVRAFRVQDLHSRISQEPGELRQTGADFDVAIEGYGWLYAQPEGGAPALTRRGDLRRDPEGVLRNGAGDAMLGPDLQPIVLPDFRSMVITDLGEIRIEPLEGAPGETVLAGLLATVGQTDGTALKRDLDGRIRALDGSVPPADQGGVVRQGVLEASNVNAVAEMVSGIEHQRGFELGMRMILTAREMDEAGSRILEAPPG
ncbi:MAG: flagellar hook-basal body complex protein [Roseicyclus sp.]|jgi:flagellar basal-body rod protein FlgF|nr:flagellar hook-basal body complex protein [Roseicyclus sp.]